MIGLLDDPVRQSQYPLRLAIGASGHVGIYGAPGSGKTTMIQTIVMALARDTANLVSSQKQVDLLKAEIVQAMAALARAEAVQHQAELNLGYTTIVSPIEGVVTHINQDVVQNPALALQDPYKDGWIATLKAPDFNTNQRNLMQASMVAPWMHYNQTRLNAEVAKLNPALAQDGGVPIQGLLQHIPAELRQRIIAEFFMN